MQQDHYTLSTGRLFRKDNTLYFLKEGENKKRSLPINQIRDIYVFGEVDFNAKLLNFLSQNNIAVHIYNYYGFYAGSYWPRCRNVSGYSVVNQSRHYLDFDKRLYLSVQFISSSIHHMLKNLRRHREKVDDVINVIEVEKKKLDSVQSIQELMGIEGNIRHHYYQSFNEILNKGFVLTKRTKRPPKDPINALISFGNQMTYNVVLSEIYKTVLDPTISFLHEPSTQRFSLSLDLAEIFKPLIVDPMIFAMINRKMVNQDDFEYFEEEICYLNNSGKKKFLSAWDKSLKRTIKHRKLNRKVSYRYLIRLECYKLIKHVIDDEQYKPLKAWW